jgi:hypothetical protein
MGEAPDELPQRLAGKFLSLLTDSGTLPARIRFYTDGVKLACEGSLVLEHLQSLQSRGVELILC